MSDEKSYKSQEDPERAFYLISACNIMRDFAKTNALAASFVRELHAMNLRQEEADQKAAKAEEGNGPARTVPRPPTSPNLSDTRR
jgi:hypothetical protein